MKKFKKIYSPCLMRSGFRNSLKSDRYLIYSLIDVDVMSNLSREKLEEINLKCKDLNEYALMYIIDENNNKKYLHIEKNGTVTLTNVPTCFIESRIVLDYKYDDLKMIINSSYNKSEYCKNYGRYHIEVLSKKECQNIWKNL